MHKKFKKNSEKKNFAYLRDRHDGKVRHEGELGLVQGLHGTVLHGAAGELRGGGLCCGEGGRGFQSKTFSISNSFKSIYRSFHIFNSRQLFRTSGPHQYSALNKKFFEKLTNHSVKY